MWELGHVSLPGRLSVVLFFFFNDTATTEIYTLSLHDALPICVRRVHAHEGEPVVSGRRSVDRIPRSEEHTSELQSQSNLVCRLLLEKKKKRITPRLTDSSSRPYQHLRHLSVDQLPPADTPYHH